MNFETLEETWFNTFWKLISQDCQALGFKERLSSVVFIIFNYDRCIEHFLYHSIQNYYGLNSEQAASLVNGLEVFHPYGMVGSLPWTNGPAPMKFGADPDCHNLVKLAAQIMTFAEGADPGGSNVEQIRYHLATADTLIFLGFAYHQQNLELLTPPFEHQRVLERQIQCYGTTLGISGPDLDAINTKLQEHFGAQLVPNEDRNLTCSDLFYTYWRAL